MKKQSKKKLRELTVREKSKIRGGTHDNGEPIETDPNQK